RNGGCTTTVRAPSSSAASTLRRSRTSGSDDHTRWVISSDGECTDRTGTPVLSDSHFSAVTSWLMESTQTITSTPSQPSSAASSNPALARSGHTDAVDSPTGIDAGPLIWTTAATSQVTP